uniref:Uncharacterized protein n=1 Tax=Auxenochlorella protothecoides TaxID=3075 RepID=A0A1D1ZZI2_AUXPR
MVGCWDRTLHTMRGVVLLLIASISCATGSSDTCEAQITPLYTSVPTWTDTATLLSAHNLRSNVTALTWIQNPGQDLTPRGGGPLTPLLAVGDGAGGVHILTAQGFVVASFTPESPSAPVSALAAWYQPGALNLLVGLEDGTLQALLVPRDGLTEAAETGIPAGVAPGAAAAPLDCRSPCSIRALRLIGNAKRRRGRDGVLPGGPVLVSVLARGGLDASEPSTAFVVRVPGASEALFDRLGPALASSQPLESPGIALLARGVLTGRAFAAAGAEGLSPPEPCLGLAGDELMAAAQGPHAVHALTRAGRLASLRLGRGGRPGCTLAAQRALPPALTERDVALTAAGGHTVIVAGGGTLAAYEAGGRGSPRGPALAARQPLAAVLAAVLSRGGRLPDSEGGMGVLLEGSASGHVAVALAGQTLAIFCLAQPQGPALPRGQGLAAGAVQILQGIGMVAVVAVVLVRAHARRKHRVESVPSVERLKAFEAMLADPKTGGRGGLTSRTGLKSHAPSGARGGAGGKSKRAHRRAHSPPLRGRADTASFENLGGSEDDNDASVHMLLSELDVEVLEEG